MAGVEILSHPFRLTSTGSAATVTDATPEAYAEGLAHLILTRRGERHLVPAFGVTDPAFGVLHPAEVTAGVALFGPPVTLVAVDMSYPSDTVERVEVVFE